MSFNNVGKVWNVDAFKAYLNTLPKPAFVTRIVLHHTAAPSLAQRPTGLTIQHIRNIQNYYQNELGWSSGPHLFIDDDEIFGMTPLSERGVHASSFNSTSIGIEVLGDYDREDNLTGRGLACWNIAAQATKALTDWLGISINNTNILFHREDPKTSKTCPGRKVTKDWVLSLINNVSFSTPEPAPPPITTQDMSKVVDYIVMNKGYTTNEAISLLVRRSDGTYFNNIKINSAVYSAEYSATIATIDDLRLIPRKQ
jgi:hypothetical protein